MTKSYRQVITHYGDIYTKQMTMAADTATRFSTASLLLNKVSIKATIQSMLLGTSTGQPYLLAANGELPIEKLDLKSLYFKNGTTGLNGTITVIGVKA